MVWDVPNHVIFWGGHPRGMLLRAGGVLTWVEECEVFVLGDATEEGSVVGRFQAARRALELLECGGAFLLGNIPDADCGRGGIRHV